jgi:hypothetical protein
MRRIVLAALVLAPVLLGGCVFAVGHGEESDNRRLTRLEQRMAAAEKKLNLEHAKAAEAPKPPETPKPPEAPKPPEEPKKP